ncbi:epigen [Notolabrus celidotus]|uniref:epigen n=1 Tax=Notolabrus celidotus TaxID=1203425 RepID=UPI0014902EEB|nr:epigen [Notolabrus celidotus]
MFTHRQMSMEKAVLSAVAMLLLLTSAGQSAILTDIPHTTEAPTLSNSSLTTELSNSTMELPQVLRTHRSCGAEHENYCENGGECMYPQDSDKPFCICTSSYSGIRCLFFVSNTHTLPELEQLIGISFGVLMLLVVLAIIFYCCAYRKCIKSAPLIKSAPSESSV